MKSVACLLLTVLLCACVSTQALKETDRQKITTVFLEQDVKVAAEMYYFGPGTSFGFLFGAIGGAIAGAADVAPGNRIREFAEDNKIFIGEIVREAFSEEIEAARLFPLVTDSPSALLILNVTQYGLSVPHGYSGRLVPVLRVTAELRTTSGQVLWKSGDNVQPLSGIVEPVLPEAIRGDPEVLRSLWTAAAKRVAKITLKDLQP